MESQHAGETSLPMHNKVKDDFQKGEDVIPEENLKPASISSSSSSSSMLSSEFSFEDPLPVETFEQSCITVESPKGPRSPAYSTSPRVDQTNHGLEPLASPHSERNHSSDAAQEDSLTLQSPPAQVMERPPGSSGYRIPSYVFARNKSGNPMEWSVTSNESLFSIHMGNMSFTKDQFSWLLKSGELNYSELSKPGNLYKPGEQIPPIPEDKCKPGESTVSNPADVDESGEKTRAVPLTAASSTTSLDKKESDDRVHATSPTAFHDSIDSDTATRKEVQVDTPVPKRTKSDIHDGAPAPSVRRSDSGQSFAFPVLTTDIEGCTSVKSSKSRSEREQHKPQSPTNSEDPLQASASKPGTQSTWFSWLYCCSCCSIYRK